MNRLQFQLGMSWNEFLAKYGQQQQCETAVEAARWPGGFPGSQLGVEKELSA